MSGGGSPGSTGGSAGWRSSGSSSKDPQSASRVWSLQAAVRGVVDDLVTTVFPAVCRVCERPLVHAGSVPVCELCLASVAPQSGPLCSVCGESLGMESERFAEGAGERVCAPCRRVPPAFARAVAYGVYEGELREMVQLLKYERVLSLARPLGEMLALAVGELGEQASEALVVAVPLFRAKQRGRGFNHAELLAQAAMRSMRRTRPDLKMRAAHGVLRRVRATESQFGLTPRARRSNLRGAFAVADAPRVAGRDVLLIDDIYTTGATARACAQVLSAAGARRVLVATVSRAQTEMATLWDGGREEGLLRERQLHFGAAQPGGNTGGTA